MADVLSESILTSVKKLIGADEGYTIFDPDIIMYINGAMMNVNQLGIGPSEGFSISDKEPKWSDLLGDRKDLEGVKTYVALKVKLVFDPPQAGYLVDAIKEQIKEWEFRLNIQAEGGI
jgi:hypothetical protein